MASRRRQLLDALVTRVTAIQVANGFHTDAGELVFWGGAGTLGPDDPETAIAIVVGDDDASHQGVNLVVVLPVEIQILVRVTDADPAAAGAAIEDGIEDIKRAVELADRRFGGLLTTDLERGETRALAREEGSTSVGAGITYRAGIVEGWGQP